MDVPIVPITEAHIESFRTALDSVAREGRYLVFLEAPPLEGVREFVTGNIRAAHTQFVALAPEGEVVGWCDVLPRPRPAIAHVGVLGIGVVNAFRGRGIGEKLMRAAIDSALRKGITRIELLVREDNARARRLYEKLGFEREGVMRRHMRIDGRYHDSILMSLLHD